MEEKHRESYTVSVTENSYVLTISADEYTELPSSLKVKDKIQLKAILGHIGAVLEEDVTDDPYENDPDEK